VDVRDFVLQQHAAQHLIIDDEILRQVPRERWTARPSGSSNSIAWLLWNVSRCEDLAVNVFVARREQALTAAGWSKHGALADSRIGTGFGDDEAAAFASAVDLDDLLAYRADVRARTAEAVRALDPATLHQRPDVDAILGELDPLFPEAGAWVRDMWRPWPASLFLSFTALGHTFMHIGEMLATKNALGLPGR
jgi:hypothetical protein